jgi:hypothetical protein
VELILIQDYGDETLDDAPHDFSWPADFKLAEGGDILWKSTAIHHSDP